MDGRHALLKADGKYELDTMAKGSLNETKDTDRRGPCCRELTGEECTEPIKVFDQH